MSEYQYYLQCVPEGQRVWVEVRRQRGGCSMTISSERYERDDVRDRRAVMLRASQMLEAYRQIKEGK